MGTYTDFFVASANDIPTMRFPEDLRARPVVLAKNITPEEIGELDFLLTGNRTREPACVRDGDVTLYRVDDDLVRALARADRPGMTQIADQWGISDADDTLEFLLQLHALADNAQSRAEGVFFYF